MGDSCPSLCGAGGPAPIRSRKERPLKHSLHHAVTHAILVSGVTAWLLAGEASAQETVIIGGPPAGPSVEVDLSQITGRGVTSPRPDSRAPRGILPPGREGVLKLRPPGARPNGPEPAMTPRPAPEIAARPPSATPQPAAAAPPRMPAAPSKSSVSAPVKPQTAPVAALKPADKPAPVAPAVATPQNPIQPVPSRAASAGNSMMLFAPGAVDLSPEAAAQLDALASSLTGQTRLQLKAHASGADNDAETRRTALKRALAARTHLLAKGVDSTRIDVRALGPVTDGGPPDRVDLIVLTQ